MALLPCSREFPASKIVVNYKKLTIALRPLRLTDAPQIFDALNESFEDLKRFMPFAHLPQSIEGQVKRLRQNMSPTLEGKEMGMGLFDESSDKLLQLCGLHSRCPLNSQGMEIGYWTPTSEAGKGYATLASQMLIIYCIEGFQLDRIQISHNVNNERSKRVIEKCGFVFEGVTRNALGTPSAEMIAAGYESNCNLRCYSLLPDEARAQSWYTPLRNDLVVFNQLDENLGYLWRN